MVEKYIKDGQVAVVYSPGYGAGWSTWNDNNPDIIFDKRIVEFVLKKDFKNLDEFMETEYPDSYVSTRDLAIGWITEGVTFRIDEYDGNESIIEYRITDYFIA